MARKCGMMWLALQLRDSETLGLNAGRLLCLMPRSVIKFDRDLYPSGKDKGKHLVRFDGSTHRAGCPLCPR
jgi:hypothetical protein